MATVSLPVQGAPPTKLLSLVEVQQRWQIALLSTLLGSVFEAFPAIMRKPYIFVRIFCREFSGPISYLLKSRGLATGDVVNIETTLVHQTSLRTSIANLGNTSIAPVLVVEEHDRCPVV